MMYTVARWEGRMYMLSAVLNSCSILKKNQSKVEYLKNREGHLRSSKVHIVGQLLRIRHVIPIYRRNRR